jgi:trehalose/maltose hydrolase-like predicted phosphorylase
MTVVAVHDADDRSNTTCDDRDAVAVASVGHVERRAIESVMTVSDGRVGWRGLCELCDSPARPGTRVAGVYDGADVPDLLPGPVASTVVLVPATGWTESVVLDMGAATVTSQLARDGVVVRTTRFASAAEPGLLVLRCEGPVAALPDAPPIRVPDVLTTGSSAEWSGDDAIVVRGPDQAIAAAAHQLVVDDADDRTSTRLVAVVGGADASAVLEQARTRLRSASGAGYRRLRADHDRAWSARWEPVSTQLSGDADAERAVRFASFHLLASAPRGDRGDEVAIGARGLTGGAYRGHVFWDTDVFVVPALCALDPVAARGALMYRWHRLDAARRRARAEGRAGARFPWESARVGDEVTPSEAVGLDGTTIPIVTGMQEEHIVADVAWAVGAYLRWTGDGDFMTFVGDEILAETARYWASRVEPGPDGRYHIRGVVGPDEYHEGVDDNAFTNLLVRHNLRQAADLLEGRNAVSDEERASWSEIASGLVDGYDPTTSVHEQFSGFHELRPVMAREVGVPPFSADAVLGHRGVRETQIIKQADVLMLHHMIPDELPPASFAADVDHYLPRTSHGSSLSPAIHAGLLARLGREDEAVELFMLAAMIDLDDITGTTAGGLHLATMGGVTQAMLHGFLGLRPTDRGMLFDPRVPRVFGRVEQGFRYHGSEVRLTVDGDRAIWHGDRTVTVLPSAGEPVTARQFEFRRVEDGWRLR